ncbi:MAG: GNAT family N-acetyltransferase, partial [Vibrio sp.]
MLIIRRVEPSDAKAVQAIYHCPQAYANTLQLPLPSVDMWQQRLSSIPEHVHAFVAELDGKV